VQHHLQDKSTLVTVSPRGVGRAIAVGFFTEGAEVAFNGGNAYELALVVSALKYMENFISIFIKERHTGKRRTQDIF